MTEAWPATVAVLRVLWVVGLGFAFVVIGRTLFGFGKRGR